VLLFFLLIACAQQKVPRAIELPGPEAYDVQQQVPIVIEQPVVTIPTPNKECRKQCDVALQSCRSKSQPPFSVCVDKARTAMKDCLRTGDDAYCRFEYSKSRTICFNSFMAGCDILFNTCMSKC